MLGLNPALRGQCSTPELYPTPWECLVLNTVIREVVFLNKVDREVFAEKSAILISIKEEQAEGTATAKPLRWDRH